MSTPSDPTATPAQPALRRRRTRRSPGATGGDYQPPPASATPPAASGFYAGALDEDDRNALDAASGVTGLDQEIAVLRLRLRRLLREHPDDYALAVRAIELLVRAVGTARRLGPAEASGVLEQISAELDGIFTLLADAGAEDPGALQR